MKITVAITGASGAIYAHRLLLALKESPSVEKVYVVMSECAVQVWDYELPNIEMTPCEKVEILDNKNFFNSIASGSNPADAMVIVPCSMGTVGRVASGVSSTLLERAADVQLKEGLPLVIAFRETPLSEIHLENLLKLRRAGAIVMPAAPSFYSHPLTIEDVADSVVERILDKILIKSGKKFRWNEK